MHSRNQSGTLDICLLVPWYGGSHRLWADGLKRHSRHRIEILALPAVHWKWRMHGAAITLAEEFIAQGKAFDLILAEDMMDVAVFSALVRSRGINLPIATYFHENQVSYPVSPRDTDLLTGRDLKYGFINYTTALASDRLYFNSQYHRASFLESLPAFLEQFPDFQNLSSVESICSKAEVLPLGLALNEFDHFRPAVSAHEKDKPLILWNHRREYDKNPAAFFDLLYGIQERELPFQLALLGKQSAATKDLFDGAKDRLGPAVIHDGEAHGLEPYASWLWRADILPVTSNQDFFGGSVIEAVYCGCHPLLPSRLAYPEHFPGRSVYYDNPEQALEMLDELIRSGRWKTESGLSRVAARYAWESLSLQYDQHLQQLVESWR